MKILHVITTISRGGAENHLLELASAQRASGLDVAIAYLKGDGYWSRDLEGLGIATHNLGLTRYGDPRPSFALRTLIARTRPDVVHAHMPPAELYSRLALMGNGRTKLVVSKHNDETFFRGIGHRLMARWVDSRASRVIAISDAVARYHSGYLGRDRTAFDVVHYGLHTAHYEAVSATASNAVRAQWGVEPHELLFGTVARLVPQKALDVMLAAFAEYVRGTAHPAKLAIVGRGELERDLKARAYQLGISDKVSFAGFREDIPAVMRAFDVFVLTSRYEGFGLVLLEAMAAGRPVVATQISAIPEIVVDGITGVLVKVDDVKSVAQGLNALGDQGRRSTYGLAGLNRVRDQFPVSRMVERTSSIYSQCLADHSPGNKPETTRKYLE